MSDTFNLVCIDLKLKLWVGQGHKQMTNFYSAPDASEKLKRFLVATEGHPLLLVRESSDNWGAHECEEFEDADED